MTAGTDERVIDAKPVAKGSTRSFQRSIEGRRHQTPKINPSNDVNKHHRSHGEPLPMISLVQLGLWPRKVLFLAAVSASVHLQGAALLRTPIESFAHPPASQRDITGAPSRFPASRCASTTYPQPSHHLSLSPPHKTTLPLPSPPNLRPATFRPSIHILHHRILYPQRYSRLPAPPRC